MAIRNAIQSTRGQVLYTVHFYTHTFCTSIYRLFYLASPPSCMIHRICYHDNHDGTQCTTVSIPQQTYMPQSHNSTIGVYATVTQFHNRRVCHYKFHNRGILYKRCTVSQCTYTPQSKHTMYIHSQNNIDRLGVEATTSIRNCTRQQVGRVKLSMVDGPVVTGHQCQHSAVTMQTPTIMMIVVLTMVYPYITKCGFIML